MIISRTIPIFQVVSSQWLWSCAERWEKSPEKLFPLRDQPLDAGKWRAKGGAPESVADQLEQQEADFLRDAMLKLSQRKVLPEALVPSLVIGQDALAEMRQDVDDELSDDDDDDDEDDEADDEPLLKRPKGDSDDDDDEAEDFS